MLKSLIFILLAAGVIALAGWAAYSSLQHGYIHFNYPDHNQYPVKGIDISHHQSSIDWDRLKSANLSFAIIKATEGGDHKDTRFQEHWQGARDIGLVPGAYHFFTFCTPGEQQARNFIDTVPHLPDTLPPAIDVEFGGNCSQPPPAEQILKELAVMSDRLKQHYGRQPLLYLTRQAFRWLTEHQELNHPLWIRNVYTRPAVKPHDWIIWQYRNRGRLDGIKGFVDMNVFNGTKEAFQHFIKTAEP